MTNTDDSGELWLMNWVRMQYEILTKDVMERARRERNDNKLEGAEAELPYGKYIRAVSNSVVEVFNPFKDFENYGLQNYDPPYLKLVNLNVDNEDDILDYVNNYGLLGILQHSYRYLNIKTKESKTDDQLVNHNNKTIYSNWHRIEYDEEPIYPLTNEKIDRARDEVIEILKGQTDLVIRKLLRNKYESECYEKITIKALNDIFNPFKPFNPFNNEPYIFFDQGKDYLNIHGSTNNEIDLFPDYDPEYSENLDDYIIDPEDHVKESDLVDTFAVWYAEPLELFIKEVRKFKKLYSYLEQIENAPDDEAREQLLMDLYLGLWRNLKPIHPKPGYNIWEQTIEFNWEIPSMLSAYYLMFYLDLTKSFYMRFCKRESCRKPFVSSLEKREYCSDTCSVYMRKKKQINREKEEEERLEAARSMSKPEEVKTLFVVEYDRNIINNDSFYLVNPEGEEDILFIEMIKTLYPDLYGDDYNIRKNKGKFLYRLKEDGVYMIDGSKQKRQTKVVYPTIRRHVREVADKSSTSVIVVSTSHGKNIIKDLKKAGFKVINEEAIDFPHGSKESNNFRKKVSELLKLHNSSIGK